ncbi:MAG: DUF1573 domain-containing protein [Ignavibacteria bacterium]|nr:DUF1573 domain-containing protein [Ignavibacteria bacterium]
MTTFSQIVLIAFAMSTVLNSAEPKQQSSMSAQKTNVIAQQNTKSTQNTKPPTVTFEPPAFVTLADSAGFVTKMIKIRNTGGGVLTMTRAQASCGCAGATIQKNNILPDSTGKVYLYVNSKSFVDTINNVDFTIHSNASNPEATFRIVVRKPENAK